MEKIEIETFKDFSNSYNVNELKRNEPSNINSLKYRKYKVTIELIGEPKEVLIERLENLLEKTIGYNSKDRVKRQINYLKNQ